MPVRELSGTPSMPALFARAAVGMIPGASRLPFVGGGASGDADGVGTPELTLALHDLRVEDDRLAAYDRVCGFDLRSTLPATYPHMLAFPMQLALMTDPSFPLPAIGLVHIHNRISQARPIDAGEALSLRVWCSPVSAHPRGRQFSLHTEACVGEELVWEEVSTNLRRGRASEGAETPPEVPSAQELPATARWRLGGDLGRRYGSVSGDLNPIHVHPLGARLFGFRSAIAHGMWTKARCLAALQERLSGTYTVEVAFRRPILLPAVVEFAEHAIESGIAFGVRDRGERTPHLDGVVRFM